MLYTGRGDQGTSKLFNTEKGVRVSKSALVFEVLGTLDEFNSFLGLARASINEKKYALPDGKLLSDAVLDLQQDMFIIQAEIAGATMKIQVEKVVHLEELTTAIESVLPPIKTFFIPGATEAGARFDVTRTVARRAERLIVAYQEESNLVDAETLRYLNRISSALYAFARLVNHIEGKGEQAPTYS